MALLEKLVFFVHRAPQLERAEFCRRYLEGHAPLVLRHCPKLRRYVVNVMDVGQEPSEAADAVAELWFDSIEDFTDRARLYDSPEGAAAVERDADALIGSTVGYRVIEHIQQDYQRSWGEGERSPGVKMVGPLRRAEALSHDEFVDYWLHRHVPLVLKHLTGMWRYITNVVTAPLTPGAPEIDGVVELHVRELQDLTHRERFYDSPEGQKIMSADSSRFLSRPSRSLATEYVLRG